MDTRLRYGLLAGVLVASALAAAAEDDPAAPVAPTPPPDSVALENAWRPIWETTYDERVAADPRGDEARADVLVVPYPSFLDASDDLPDWLVERGARPYDVAAGEPLVPAGRRVAVWRVLPRHERHDEYLEKRAELLGEGNVMGLVRWSVRQKLVDHALFDIRQMLGGDAKSAAYGRFNALWKKHAATIRPAYALDLPVEGEWFVTPAPHHRAQHWSTFAADLVMLRGGRSSRGTGARNADFHSWGQPVVAQAEGVVVATHDGTPDNPVGTVNARGSANLVEVDYGGLRVIYAHFRKGSVAVERGERVKPGQILGVVGNSGMSTAPHLHMQVQDAGSASVRGRFTVDVRRERSKKWKRIEGGDLRGGYVYRNLPRGERAPPR